MLDRWRKRKQKVAECYLEKFFFDQDHTKTLLRVSL
jgi:hypothetical protein